MKKLVVGIACMTLMMPYCLAVEPGSDKWPLTSSNSGITDVPTLHDFVPLGTEFIKTQDGELKWNGLKWRLSCFIFVGIGKTKEGESFLFQIRIPHPVHGQTPDHFADMFFIDGEWRKFYALIGPPYYDDGEMFDFPTVYCYGKYRDGKKCMASMSYNIDEREWIYKVVPLEGNEVNVEIKLKPRGVTYWMGKPEGPYIIHGAIFNKEDIDIWGGFWEIGEVTGWIEKPGVKRIEFTGHAIWDRAYHRVYYSDTAVGAAGAPLWFTCGYIYAKEFQLAIGYAENPSPIKPPVPFQHQGRLSFPSRGLSFRFDNYTLEDNGDLQPSRFYINGSYEGGEVRLVGDVALFYPTKWGVGRGTWWDYNANRTWGRAFINWRGTITLYNETIDVNSATGVFENTRYKGTTSGNISVEIKKPLEGYLYIFDRQIAPTSLGNTLIIGSITVETDARGEISKVEFYIDDNLKSTDYDKPYSWLWDEKVMGRYKIRVIAYDSLGEKGGDEIDVIVFNWGEIG